MEELPITSAEKALTTRRQVMRSNLEIEGARLAPEHLATLKHCLKLALLRFKQDLQSNGSNKWEKVEVSDMKLSGQLNSSKGAPELIIDFRSIPRLNKSQEKRFKNIIREEIKKANLEGRIDYKIWIRVIP